MSPRTYLITGANRGIGLALVNEIASKSDVLIFAGVRDPSRVPELKAIADKYPGIVEVVPFVAADVANNKALAQTIKDKVGHIDTVVANAGIFTHMASIAETSVEAFREHLEVNTVGVLVLFQAMLDLLKASSAPKFIPVSSGFASLTLAIAFDVGFGTYGVSKVGLNFLARKIHFENPWIVCFPLAPGAVTTDMSKQTREMDRTGGIAAFQDSAALTLDVAAPLLVDIIDKAKREDVGGEFINVDGTKITW